MLKKATKSPDEILIHPEINKMMNYLNLDNCIITELNGINEIQQIHISNKDINVSQHTLDEHINDILNLKKSFQPDSSKKQIKENDTVLFSIVKYDGDDIIYSNDEEYIKIDENNTSMVAQALLGKTKGEVIETFENDQGKQYRYSLVIKDIGNMITPVFNDDFAKKYLNENSVTDYLKSVENSLSNDNKNMAILEAQDTILQKIIDKSKFSLDENQVTDYSITVVNSYVNEAYLYNKNLKDYYTEYLNMTEKEFFDNCYKIGENEIKDVGGRCSCQIKRMFNR